MYALNLSSTILLTSLAAEAAALYCFKKAEEHSLETDDCYLIVDCGGGTVDLTVRRILGGGECEVLDFAFPKHAAGNRTFTNRR